MCPGFGFDRYGLSVCGALSTDLSLESFCPGADVAKWVLGSMCHQMRDRISLRDAGVCGRNAQVRNMVNFNISY